jgi:hypothetical protein
VPPPPQLSAKRAHTATANRQSREFERMKVEHYYSAFAQDHDVFFLLREVLGAKLLPSLPSG